MSFFFLEMGKARFMQNFTQPSYVRVHSIVDIVSKNHGTKKYTYLDYSSRDETRIVACASST
jgi:hypothetical protein